MMLRNAALAIAILFAGVLKAQVAFDDNDLEKIEQAEGKSAKNLLAPKPLESGLCLDVTYYRCFWNIDPNVREISGNVTISFTTLQPGIDSVSLDLSYALTVDSVTYHSQTRPWYHVMDVLAISLPTSLAQGTVDSVTVFYHGIPFTGSGSFIQDNHQGVPGIWTLSEPYGASDWWPCRNGLTDKADSVDIYIRTPAGNRSASNGLLVSETQEGDHVVAHWKHRYPIAAYLVAVAVTNYARFDMAIPYGNKTLPMVTYVYPEDSITAVNQSAIIVDMVQLFDSLFGIYPFQKEKYGHAQWNVGGGMEHQTMTFLDSFGFELMAHELAHQWYGNAVTCGSWTDIWLNEGFATYLSGLCYEFLAPQYWKRFREVRVKNIISQPGGSVYCPDTTDISRIFSGRLSYAKGAMILHQLRWIYGDTVFFTAMNHYLHDPDLYYGFVRNSDFKSHFEAVCGQDLTWYFDDWYTGEGYPSYDIHWSQNGNLVSLTVKQSQSHPSVSFFEMIIPVRLKNAERDTMVRLENTFSGQTYFLDIPFTVDSVIFDPESQLISGNNIVNALSENEILPRISVYPNPASRYLTFRFAGLSPTGHGTLRIFDLSGRIREALTIDIGKIGLTLDISRYSPGLYSYILTWQDSQVNGKFLVIAPEVSE